MTARDRRRALIAAALLLPLFGCALLEALEPPPPAWVAVRGERRETPPGAPLRSVLVLPFNVGDAVPAHAESLRAAFAQVLRDACGFEIVAPDPAALPRTTRDELTSGSARDAAALVRLHREWDADAVLYGRVAFSRAHGEPAVGLELELVDARDGSRLWHAHDVVDSRDPLVRASLLQFRREESDGAADDPTQVPFDTFSRFVASSYVRTLFDPPLPAPASTAPPMPPSAARPGPAPPAAQR